MDVCTSVCGCPCLVCLRIKGVSRVWKMNRKCKIVCPHSFFNDYVLQTLIFKNILSLLNDKKVSQETDCPNPKSLTISRRSCDNMLNYLVFALGPKLYDQMLTCFLVKGSLSCTIFASVSLLDDQ